MGLALNGQMHDGMQLKATNALHVQECNLAGKPIYVTRVVDTMIDAPRPTRAEATGRAAGGSQSSR